MGDELKWLLKEEGGHIFKNPHSQKWAHPSTQKSRHNGFVM